MKKIFIAIACMVYSAAVNAQQGSVVQALKSGDQCPDFEFINILNYTSKAIHLSDLKGKLVILDFWTTYCGSCIENFPGLDALQHQFADKIIILPVSDEKNALTVVPHFWAKNDITRKLSLPTAIDSHQILARYLPRTAVPFEVWIDDGGRLIATTNAEEVNAANIKKYLDGAKLSLTQASQVNHTNGDLNKPLLYGGAGSSTVDKKDIFFNSTLIGKIEGLPGTYSPPTSDGNTMSVRITNLNIQQLYKVAFFKNHYSTKADGSGNYPFYQSMNSRMALDVTDSSLYFWPGKNTKLWPKQPLFCYEITIPRSDSAKIYQYMQADMNRMFGAMYGIQGAVRKRDVQCLALVRTSPKDMIHSAGGNAEVKYDALERTGHIRNCNLYKFMYMLVVQYTPLYKMPIVDETDYKEPVDLDLTEVDMKDIASVRKMLRKYDLDLVEKTSTLDMIVISSVSH